MAECLREVSERVRAENARLRAALDDDALAEGVVEGWYYTESSVDVAGAVSDYRTALLAKMKGEDA